MTPLTWTPHGRSISVRLPRKLGSSGRGGEPQMPIPVIPPRPTEVFEDAEIIRKKKNPEGQPTATSPTQRQPIIDDREEFKGQPIAGKVQGETVGYDVDPRDSQDYRDAIPTQIREKQPLEGDPGGDKADEEQRAVQHVVQVVARHRVRLEPQDPRHVDGREHRQRDALVAAGRPRVDVDRGDCAEHRGVQRSKQL